MSSASAIIKVNEVFYDKVEFTSYETGNGDFFANGFRTMAGLFMLLLSPANEESEIVKEIRLLGGDPSDTNWLKNNANKFISIYRVKEKLNSIETQEEEEELRNKIEREENSTSTIESLMKYAPSSRCNVIVTDPKYISHLVQDAVFETTAFDIL